MSSFHLYLSIVVDKSFHLSRHVLLLTIQGKHLHLSSFLIYLQHLIQYESTIFFHFTNKSRPNPFVVFLVVPQVTTNNCNMVTTRLHLNFWRWKCLVIVMASLKNLGQLLYLILSLLYHRKKIVSIFMSSVGNLGEIIVNVLENYVN